MSTTATKPTYEEEFPIAASAARVWSALTDPAALRVWLDDRIDVELRIGGGFAFSGRRTPTFGHGASTDQVITALTPGRSLAFRWKWAGSPSQCEITIEEAGALASRLRLRHHLASDIAGIPSSSQHYLLRDFWHVAIGNLRSFLRCGAAAVVLDHAGPVAEAAASIEINATRERVWHVLTEPVEMRRWLEPDAEFGLSPRVELRVGGAYSFGWGTNAEPMGPTTIVELEAPRRLRHGWRHGGDSSNATEWTLAPISNGRTRLTVRQLGTAHERERNAYASGWGSFLFDIAHAAETAGAPSEKTKVAPSAGTTGAPAAPSRGSHGS